MLLWVYKATYHVRYYNCLPAKSFQLCLTLCDPTDCSLPGSSAYRILQIRIVDWVAMPSSRESSQSRVWTCVSYVSCIGRQVLYKQCHLLLTTPQTKIVRIQDFAGGPVAKTPYSQGRGPRFDPWRRKWQPTPVFLPGESQGRRNLVGCRLWGRTESGKTEAT